MTREDLLFIATGIDPEPARDCHECETQIIDEQKALEESIALVELLMCRGQMRQAGRAEGYQFMTFNLLKLRAAHDALRQIIERRRD